MNATIDPNDLAEVGYFCVDVYELAPVIEDLLDYLGKVSLINAGDEKKLTHIVDVAERIQGISSELWQTVDDARLLGYGLKIEEKLT